MDDDHDPKFPLGTPVNRKPPPAETAVAGRPGWWRDAHGVEHFVPDEDRGYVPLDTVAAFASR